MCHMTLPARNLLRGETQMTRWPTPMQETELATALHDAAMVDAVPTKPLDKQTKLWLRELLKKKGIKFDEPS